MQALPYRFIGPSDLEALERILSPAVNTWAETWFYCSEQAALTCTTDNEASGGEEWLVFGAEPDAWIAWQLHPTSIPVPVCHIRCR